MQTPSWPSPEQLAKPVIPIIPKVQGRRAFLPAIDQSVHEFIVPCKKITDHSLMETWLTSEAYVRLIDFFQSLNDSVKDTKVSVGASKPRSPTIVAILAILDEMDAWITDIPPDTSSVSRFGNIAFRSWIERLNQVSGFISVLSHPNPLIDGPSFVESTRPSYTYI